MPRFIPQTEEEKYLSTYTTKELRELWLELVADDAISMKDAERMTRYELLIDITAPPDYS